LAWRHKVTGEFCTGGFELKTEEYHIKPQPKQPKYLYVIKRMDGTINLIEPQTLFHGTLLGKIEVQDDN
jgi:hypothetical protein